MCTPRLATAVAVVAVLLVGCGDQGESSGDDDRPTVVVTTAILGDVVERLVGDSAEVVTIMPPGVEPHDFAASARQAAAMREADALVVNGGGFEEGLVPVVDAAAADGTPTYEATDAVDLVEGDPHFFTDPSRMADAAAGIAAFLAEEVPGFDDEAAEDEVAALRQLDAELATVLEGVGHRTMVTDHEVFPSFADRYGFEVVGTVVPGATATGGPSAAGLAELVDTIEATGVVAIFVGEDADTRLADTLADEVGSDVAVVELFSETLGPEGSDGATYPEMMRTNVERIAAALG